MDINYTDILVRLNLAVDAHAKQGWGCTTIALIAGMKPSTLRRKLDGHGELTVPEVAGLAHALALSFEELFTPVEPPKQLLRCTEPGNPTFEEAL